MSIKALFTTMILGSSSVAMAEPLVKFNASASLRVGGPTVVTDYRDDAHRHYTHAHVHDQNCTATHTSLPVRPVTPTRPVNQQVIDPYYGERFWTINNTRVAARSSTYIGRFFQPSTWSHRQAGYSGYPSYPAYQTAQTWFRFTEPTRIDSGRLFFNVQGTAGLFRQLRVQNLGGRSEIRQVVIEFGKGRDMRVQKVRFDTVIDRSNPSLTLKLQGDSRTINRVIVYGDTARGSAIQLQGL